MAIVEHPIAARREAAALEHLPQWRHHARDRRERVATLGAVGQGAQQQPRVGVLRRGEKFGRLGHLDDLACIHQRHAMRHAGDDGEVVRDQQQAHALLFLQGFEQVEDLRLDGHVERGRGLVGDQKVGFGRERHRDHDALLLPARHAKRVVVDAPRRLRNADLAEPLDRLRARSGATQWCVRLNGLDDLVADPHHRVQAGRRLLKDHADAPAAHRTHARFGQREHVGAFERDLAVRDVAVLGQQPHQRKRSHALAAARFADEREGLAALDREREAVDRLDEAGLGVECDLEVGDVQHRQGKVLRSRMLMVCGIKFPFANPFSGLILNCSAASLEKGSRITALSPCASSAESCGLWDRTHRARRPRTGWRRARASP